MLGIDRKCETVKKTPALRRRAGEQRVHCRHQPYDPQMIGEGRRRWRRLAIDPVSALDCGVVIIGRSSLYSGAERRQSQGALDFGSDGPRPVTLAEGHFIESGPAQTASWRKKRNGFD